MRNGTHPPRPRRSSPYTAGLNLAACGAATDKRGFVPVDDYMRVLGADGTPVEGLYCIGDANGKLMLAHAASAQGISAVETMCGRPHAVNHLAVPAACFTHPEVSFVGLTQEQAEALGKERGFPVKVSKTSFKGNSKALAELEPDGMAKMIYNGATGEILGVHIFGLHAADLIHEASNAMLVGSTVQQLKFAVHAHPTLAEVVDEVFKRRARFSGPLPQPTQRLTRRHTQRARRPGRRQVTSRVTVVSCHVSAPTYIAVFVYSLRRSLTIEREGLQ